MRPKVDFYDLHYFPKQDVMISSNGEIYTRQDDTASTTAYLKKRRRWGIEIDVESGQALRSEAVLITVDFSHGMKVIFHLPRRVAA